MANKSFEEYCRSYFVKDKDYEIGMKILNLLEGKSIYNCNEILSCTKQCLYNQPFKKEKA